MGYYMPSVLECQKWMENNSSETFYNIQA